MAEACRGRRPTEFAALGDICLYGGKGGLRKRRQARPGEQNPTPAGLGPPGRFFESPLLAGLHSQSGGIPRTVLQPPGAFGWCPQRALSSIRYWGDDPSRLSGASRVGGDGPPGLPGGRAKPGKAGRRKITRPPSRIKDKGSNPQLRHRLKSAQRRCGVPRVLRAASLHTRFQDKEPRSHRFPFHLKSSSIPRPKAEALPSHLHKWNKTNCGCRQNPHPHMLPGMCGACVPTLFPFSAGSSTCLPPWETHWTTLLPPRPCSSAF